jgi:DNA-binding beta-propeller fold protein YncE
MKPLPAVAGIALGGALLVSQSGLERRTTGPMPGGGFRVSTGWTIRPAGKQIPLDTFPMASAMSPDKKFVVIMNAGYNPPSLQVFDVAKQQVIGKVSAPDLWLGLAFTRNGRLLYASGGSRSEVYEYTFSPEGVLAPARTFTVTAASERKHTDFLGDLTISPDDRMLYVNALFRDEVVVINPQSGRVVEKFKSVRRPYRVLFHPDGKSYFVTSWSDGLLGQYDASNGSRINLTRIGPHATDMMWRDKVTSNEEGEQLSFKARLFVTASNTNRVYVVGVGEQREARVIETINVSLTPTQPLGMTPSALALSNDLDKLFVVCSDTNAVAVVDVSAAKSRVLGFVPAGWYPTAARTLPGGELMILNGRGLRSYPNAQDGPNPMLRPSPSHQGLRATQYVGRLQTGSASIVKAPFDGPNIAEQTRATMANTPYRDAMLDTPRTPQGNPVPGRPGEPSPIRHVIYIVKENRTYDQVLGDLGKGNADPSLCLFPEKISPNHHKLAREFVLFDNFYVSADVSADGHNWTTAAIAPDYVQKMWPNSYAGRRRHYDYEGQEPAATPPAGYIWSQALQAGLTVRNYAYFATNSAKAAPTGERQIESVRDPALAPHTNMKYRAFDMDYPDVDRARIFIEDLAGFERDGNMPRLMLVRLGNDHTSGTAAGKITPLSAVADNDYALGMIVEACSRSKFWREMAIFVLEDDAQNGPDHVDSHRSPAFVLSPYTRRPEIDSTFYNTTSMLRTIELILGLRPMTTFDAAAQPMWNAFSASPNAEPYSAEKPRIPLTDRNPATAAGARRSEQMDFSDADRIDDDELNDILWAALKGGEPPAPVRSYFGR